MKFDVVLFERELDRGLTKTEINSLLDICKGEEVIPVEFQGESSSAMGFISLDMAEEILYFYDVLETDVVSILNNMDQETDNHVYEYEEYKVYLSR